MFHAPLGLISGPAQLKWHSMLREQKSNDSRGATGCAVSRKRLTAGWEADRRRLACNFIIAFRCMFPVVAIALAINRRLIAHTRLLPRSVHACGALTFILSELRGQSLAWCRGRGETKLRFN